MVSNLQTAIDFLIDSEKPVADGLRALTVVAHRCQASELMAWADLETNGYQGANPVPTYRLVASPLVRINFMGSNGYRDAVFLYEKELPESLRFSEGISLRQSVADIESMVASKNECGIPLPHLWVAEYFKAFEARCVPGFTAMRPNTAEILLPRNHLAGALSSTRAHGLKLAMAVEDQLREMDDDSQLLNTRLTEVQQVTQTYLIENVYGGIGNLNESGAVSSFKNQVNYNSGNTANVQADDSPIDFDA